MVKRAAILILTLIYSISCLGMSVERFYCCGKLARTSFVISDGGNSENTAHKSDNCCKTITQSFKIKDQHVGAKTSDLQAKAFVALQPVAIEFQPVIASSERSATAYEANAPPRRQSIPVYILNCTYRI